MQTVKYQSNACATPLCPKQSGQHISRPKPLDPSQRSQISHSSNCRPFDVTENDVSKQTIGMAYVPGQKWTRIYDLKNGFKKGTIFSELEKPLLVKGGTH